MTLDTDHFADIIKKASTMKINMIAKGVTRAKAKCPYCEGHWHGILAGPNKHLHFKCDGSCNVMLMT